MLLTPGGLLRFSFILALVLSGCVGGAQYIRWQDGSEVVAIDCRRTETYCLQSAGEECPQGYDVLERTGELHASAGVVGAIGGYETRHDGRMVVKCHGKSAKASTPEDESASERRTHRGFSNP